MSNHISHAALPYPIKNARYTILVPYLDADGDPTDPTTPDTEVSQDGGAFADATEEMTTISGSNGMGYITLTGAETNNSAVGVAAKVASGPKNTLATLYPRNLPILASGTASAGASGTITLASSITYDITGCFVRTTGGTGGGGTGGANNQARRITAYNTSTQVATVTPNWETTPDSTTTYDVLCPEGITIGMLKALNPTTAGNTLDVSSGGEAGLDWANIGSKTTTNALTNTTIATTQQVDLNTIKTQAVTCSGGVTVPAATLASTTNITSATGVDVTKVAGTTVASAAAGYFPADNLKWLGGTIPAVNVTGVPLVDAKYLLGTIFSTPTVAGIPNVNVKTWNDLTTVALPLVPTTAGRTLDVSATGEAGVDWANVGGQSTSVNLSATTINLVNTATTVTNQLTAAQIATGVWQDTTASDFTTALSIGKSIMNGVSLGTGLTINAYTGNTPQTGDSYAIVNSGTFGNAAIKGYVDDIGVAGAGLTALGDTRIANLDATVSSRATTAGVASQITTDHGSGSYLTATSVVVSDKTGFSLTSAYDFAKGTVAVTESYNSDGSAPTPVQALMVIMQMLTEMSISGTTMTIKKLDGSTTALILTLDSATTPAVVTRTG